MDVSTLVIDGHLGHAFLGESLAAHGDISGDGTPELWVSGRSIGLPLSGRHLVTDVLEWGFDVPPDTLDENESWGSPRCGDINGDDFEDWCRAGRGVHFGPLGIDEPIVAPDIAFGGEFLHADVLKGETRYSLYRGYDNADDLRGQVEFDHPPVTGEVDTVITGMEPGDKVGNWASTGDLTGDGVDDVLVSSILRDARRGRAWIHDDAHRSGSLTESTRVFTGTYAGDALGRTSVVADFDGDGAEDLAIALSSSSFGPETGVPGRVAVFAGPIAPGTYSEEDATRTWYGGLNDDDFGFSLVAADFDGDGLPELAVGAPEDDRVQPSGGVVYVIPEPLGGG